MGLDENICTIYKTTNEEIRKMLVDSQEKMYKTNSILALIIIVLCITISFISYLNYKNNENWKDVFNSYEYVTEVTTYQQDGNGINTYNDGTMGDIINGTNYNSDTKDIGKEK
jgi:amino acid permease